MFEIKVIKIAIKNTQFFKHSHGGVNLIFLIPTAIVIFNLVNIPEVYVVVWLMANSMHLFLLGEYLIPTVDWRSTKTPHQDSMSYSLFLCASVG